MRLILLILLFPSTSFGAFVSPARWIARQGDCAQNLLPELGPDLKSWNSSLADQFAKNLERWGLPNFARSSNPELSQKNRYDFQLVMASGLFSKNEASRELFRLLFLKDSDRSELEAWSVQNSGYRLSWPNQVGYMRADGFVETFQYFKLLLEERTIPIGNDHDLSMHLLHFADPVVSEQTLSLAEELKTTEGFRYHYLERIWQLLQESRVIRGKNGEWGISGGYMTAFSPEYAELRTRSSPFSLFHPFYGGGYADFTQRFTEVIAAFDREDLDWKALAKKVEAQTGRKGVVPDDLRVAMDSLHQRSNDFVLDLIASQVRPPYLKAQQIHQLYERWYQDGFGPQPKQKLEHAFFRVFTSEKGYELLIRVLSKLKF
ncbi:MAG: hypothetical protein JNL01_10230 [Bdellovibrionales bacterium]|nr:hypothetical protein [Bdellovibrionales bacterium]